MAVYRKNFLSKMIKLKQEIGETKNREAAVEYVRLNKFVLGCTYTKYYKAKNLVQYFLGGHTSEQCSVYLGISQSNTRDQLRLISDILFNIFGEDFFELFENFKSNAKEIRKRLYVSDHSTYTSCDYISVDLLNLITSEKPKKVGKYKIEECRNEFKFIIKHSNPVIRSELKVLDKSKLNFLIGVLDGNMGTIDERFNFIKSLETKEEDEDVFANL